jgi:hypothetical protein
VCLTANLDWVAKIKVPNLIPLSILKHPDLICNGNVIISQFVFGLLRAVQDR